MARFDPLRPSLRAGEVALPFVSGEPRPEGAAKKVRRRKRRQMVIRQKQCWCILCHGKTFYPDYYGEELVKRGERKIDRERLARDRQDYCGCAMCTEALAQKKRPIPVVEMKPEGAADEAMRVWVSFECRIEDQAVDPDAEEFARLRNEPVRAGLGAWASTPELERQFRWSETDPRGELVERRRQIGVLLARLEGNLITDVRPHWPKDWQKKVREWIAGEVERIDLALKEKNF